MSVEIIIEDNKELEKIKEILGDKYLFKKCDNKLVCKKKYRKTLVRVALANEMKYISFEIFGSVDFEKTPLEDFFEYRRTLCGLIKNFDKDMAVVVVECSDILYTTDEDTFVLNKKYSIHHYVTNVLRSEYKRQDFLLKTLT